VLLALIVVEASGDVGAGVACSLAAVPPIRPETAAVIIMVFREFFIVNPFS
jgi:hypothetical protein